MVKETVKNINKDIERIQKKIPDPYNKLELATNFFNNRYDLFTSITTRGDGKTYGYYQMMLQLALKYPSIKPQFWVRHHELRNDIIQTVEEILIDKIGVNAETVISKRLPNYVIVFANNMPVALIVAIDHAGDLKQASDILSKFKFIVYDEFLALPEDYLANEMWFIETMLTSIDRNPNSLMPNPKMLLLGNPVNWDSQLLSYYGMLNALEKQPINTIQEHPLPNSEDKYQLIERIRNDNVNKTKSSSLVIDNSGSTSGEFFTNTKYIASDEFKLKIKHKVTIKIDTFNYLTIHYNSRKEFYLQITSKPIEYQYCYNLADVNEYAEIIPEYRLDPEFSYYYEKGKILFSDTMSLRYITSNDIIKSTNFYYMLKRKEDVPQVTQNRLNYEAEYIKRTKERLFKEYEVRKY